MTQLAMKEVVILIVDDDRNICIAFSRMLDALGCTIEVAYSLADGIRLMAELVPMPSFVFLDLNFPDSRGEDTIRSIPRFHEINPRASIIIITGLIDSKLQQMANTMGASFRGKPDLRSQEDIWRALEEAIEIARQHGIEPYEVTSKVLFRISELRTANQQGSTSN